MLAFRSARGKNRQRGASAVEFALVAPMLVFLLMACVELSAIFWANLTMQYAVREGVRYAVTGRSDLDKAATPQRTVAVIQKIQDNSMGLFGFLSPMISVNNGTPAAGPADYTSTMFGKPGDILVVRLDCTWSLLTPLLKPFFTNGKYQFSVAATMRNEAFS